MDIKERILDVLRNELEPFGYRYVKSQSEFKRKVDKDTIVYLYYNASQYHRGFTTVSFYANGDYRDLRRELHNQSIIDGVEYWHYGFCSRLEWLVSRTKPSLPLDFVFCVNDTEEVVNDRLKSMAWYVRTYFLPFMERLSHRSSALEEAIILDRRFLIANDYLIPIMYAVWKHDKKAALDYLEETGHRLLSLLDPNEWDRLERMKKGEHIKQDERPIHAFVYEDYIKGAQKVREWIESQNYD